MDNTKSYYRPFVNEDYFKEIQEGVITYFNDTYQYEPDRIEKEKEVRDITNIKDNGMYLLGMLDQVGFYLVVSGLSLGCRRVIQDKLLSVDNVIMASKIDVKNG